MISPATVPLQIPAVVRSSSEISRLADVLRDDAAMELRAAMDGATCKRMGRARFPGMGVHGVSRAMNGCASNPLYRLATLFLLMKRMGMGREGAERILGWLREIVDLVWPPDEEEDPRAVLDTEQQLDALDDGPQQRLAWGDPGAAAEMLEAVRRQHAHAPRVIAVLRRLAATPHLEG